jgi:hypothetical protein
MKEYKAIVTYSEAAQKIIKPCAGDLIRAYGQEAIIDEIHDYIDNKFICHLNQSIIVPDKTYCRDYITSDEIQEIIYL